MRPQRVLIRGEVWHAALDPVIGHEQAGTRPVVIVSASAVNQTRSRVIVIVHPPNGGLGHRSFAMCDMVRSISRDRLRFFLGRLDHVAMDLISDRLSIILDL